jgi:hypothetical protein
MDEDPGWRALSSGDLLHVDNDLEVTVDKALAEAPAHQLALSDLDPRTAASQAPRR